VESHFIIFRTGREASTEWTVSNCKIVYNGFRYIVNIYVIKCALFKLFSLFHFWWYFVNNVLFSSHSHETHFKIGWHLIFHIPNLFMSCTGNTCSSNQLVPTRWSPSLVKTLIWVSPVKGATVLSKKQFSIDWQGHNWEFTLVLPYPSQTLFRCPSLAIYLKSIISWKIVEIDQIIT